MYLSLRPLLSKRVSFAQVFCAALSEKRALGHLLSDAADEHLLHHLQQVSSAGPILLDLGGADREMRAEEIEQITLAIRDHWHEHGFCIVASADPDGWRQAAFRANQPLLHWQSLTPHAGRELLGYQFRARQREVFRLLVAHGRVTAGQIATNPNIFSQLPNAS